MKKKLTASLFAAAALASVGFSTVNALEEGEAIPAVNLVEDVKPSLSLDRAELAVNGIETDVPDNAPEEAVKPRLEIKDAVKQIVADAKEEAKEEAKKEAKKAVQPAAKKVLPKTSAVK